MLDSQSWPIAPITDPAETRSTDLRLSPASTTPLLRAEPLATQVAQRLAALPIMSDRDAPLELTLDPPELGAIRVSVTRGTDGVVLHLHADLPETLDLLRRHGAALAQELQRQGLDHAGFSFSSQHEGGRHAATAPLPSPSQDDTPADNPTLPPESQAAPTPDRAGLDLRL